MQPFEYASPSTLKEALALLGSSWDDAQVLAGGTDQLALMKEDIHKPRRLVDIKRIKELGGISQSAAGLRIGAVVTVDQLLANPLVRTGYPLLIQAAQGIRSPQIRNMGTVGGDLCQRPRCWYFRNGFGLLALKNGRSMVPDGQNEFHAIFGSGQAYFVSASSFGPPLVALGAKLTVASASGSRTVEADAFFRAPASESQREVDLQPGEILTEIIVPPARGARTATYEVRQKNALDWPIATASVVLRMKGAAVGSAMVVLGHVAPTPYVATEAGAMLAGKTINADVAAQAGQAAVAAARPLNGNHYKVQIASVAVKRALMAAAGVKG